MTQTEAKVRCTSRLPFRFIKSTLSAHSPWLMALRPVGQRIPGIWTELCYATVDVDNPTLGSPRSSSSVLEILRVGEFVLSRIPHCWSDSGTLRCRAIIRFRGFRLDVADDGKSLRTCGSESGLRPVPPSVFMPAPAPKSWRKLRQSAPGPAALQRVFSSENTSIILSSSPWLRRGTRTQVFVVGCSTTCIHDDADGVVLTVVPLSCPDCCEASEADVDCCNGSCETLSSLSGIQLDIHSL